MTAVPDKGYRFVGWKCVKAADSAEESLDSADHGFVSTDITYNYVPENGSETDSDNTDTLYALFEEAPEADENSSTAKVSGTLIAKTTVRGKNSLVISWSKVKGAEGYDIFLGRNKKAKKVKTIKGNRKFRWIKNRLKKKAPYKVQKQNQSGDSQLIRQDQSQEQGDLLHLRICS